MSHACDTPLSWDALVDYWTGDITGADADRIEEQLFACGACTTTASFVAKVAHVIKSSIPPIIDAGGVAALRARGLVVVENEFLPDVRKTAHFARGIDILLHRLRGLELEGAERVAIIVKAEKTGDVIFEEMFAPFDRDRGEVMVACQNHFALYPSDIQFDVRVHAPNKPPSTKSFFVPHVFEPAPDH